MRRISNVDGEPMEAIQLKVYKYVRRNAHRSGLGVATAEQKTKPMRTIDDCSARLYLKTAQGLGGGEVGIRSIADLESELPYPGQACLVVSATASATVRQWMVELFRRKRPSGCR